MGTFDPATFRRDGAAYCKFLIRARRILELESITPDQARAWEIPSPDAESHSAIQLLEAADRRYGRLLDQVDVCGSGGVAEAEMANWGEQKLAVIQFLISRYDLQQAITTTARGESVDWDSLACWDRLDDVRRQLDSLPDVASTDDAVPRIGECPVMLAGRDELPAVLGQSVNAIPPAEYDALSALVERFPHRQTAVEIRKHLARTGSGFVVDPGGALRRLAKRHSLWRTVLLLPPKGGSRAGYGLRSEAAQARVTYSSSSQNT